MNEDFAGHSVVKLVHRFLKRKDKERQKALGNQIFGLCYKRFDEQIRAYLRYKDIPYEVNEEYYNTVFEEIYLRVFSLNRFHEKLKKFDLNKEFYPWFCSVVRGEVRDWLRKVNPETKLSNLEKLKSIAQNRAKEKCLEELRGEYPEPGALDIASTGCESTIPCEGERDSRIRNLINALPPLQRTVIRLEFVAYEDLGPEDVAYIARKTGRTKNEVGQKICELQKSLSKSPQFKKNESKKLLVTSLGLREENLKRKVFFFKNNVVVLGSGSLEEFEQEADKITLKEINERIKLQKVLINKKSHRGGKAAVKSHGSDLAKLYYMEAFKRLRKTRKEREEIIGEYRNGGYKLYSRPSTDQMASILGVKTGTIGSTKSKAKEALLRGIEKLQVQDQSENSVKEKEKRKIKIHREK